MKVRDSNKLGNKLLKLQGEQKTIICKTVCICTKEKSCSQTQLKCMLLQPLL